MIFLIIALLIRWFIRFNTYRMGSFLAGVSLQNEINKEVCEEIYKGMSLMERFITSMQLRNFTNSPFSDRLSLLKVTKTLNQWLLSVKRTNLILEKAYSDSEKAKEWLKKDEYGIRQELPILADSLSQFEILLTRENRKVSLENYLKETYFQLKEQSTSRVDTNFQLIVEEDALEVFRAAVSRLELAFNKVRIEDRFGLLYALRKSFGRTPRAFGGLDQMREEFKLRFPLVRMQVKVGMGAVVDSVLLLPGDNIDDPDIVDCSEPFKERIGLLEESIKKVNLKKYTLNEKRASNISSWDSLETFDKPIFMINNPNAGLYELAYLSSEKFIQDLLKNGIYVFIWNYRGYGNSTGSPGMENFIQDGRTLYSLLDSFFKPSLITVYGRSIGGHVAKDLSDKTSSIVIDRSFSSISMVPIMIFGLKWVQQAYDFFIDNYRIGVEKLMHSNADKLLVYDPINDEIISHMNSLVVGVSADVLNNEFSNKVNLRPSSADFEMNSMLSSHWKYRVPFYARTQNCFLQTKYYDYVMESHKQAEAVLSMDEINSLARAIRKVALSIWCYSHNKNNRGGSPVVNFPEVDNFASSSSERSTAENSNVDMTDSTISEKNFELLTEQEDPENSQPDKEEGSNFYKVCQQIDMSLRYLENVEDENKRNMIDKFPQSLIQILGVLESGGIYLLDIFLNYQGTKDKELFCYWIMNYFLWGSLSFKETIPNTAQNSQTSDKVQNGYNQLNTVIKDLGSMVQILGALKESQRSEAFPGLSNVSLIDKVYSHFRTNI